MDLARVESKTGRNAVLQLVTSVNILVGAVFLVVSCFVSSTWGAGLAFQATSTAVVHLGVEIILLWRLKHLEIQRPLDLLAGAFLVMLVMLLQTYVSWAGLSEGFFNKGGGDLAPCIVVGRSWMDKPTSALAGLLLMLNLCILSLVVVWRDDFRGEYTSLPHPTEQTKV